MILWLENNILTLLKKLNSLKKTLQVQFPKPHLILSDFFNIMNNLSEFSKTYYQEHYIYKIFSEAEDYPDFIFQYLENEFYDKFILDLGCGNGKYSQKTRSVFSRTAHISD